MTENTGTSFDQIAVGDTASFSVTITEEMHEAFAKISGDTSPIHTDDNFAQKNGYERKIGYAFHISSLLSQVYGMHLPGGSSVCLKQETSFPNSWYPGDTISIEAEVVRKIMSTQILEIQVEMKRQSGAVVLRGTGTVKLLR